MDERNDAPVVSATNLTRRFKALTAVDGLRLAVQRGEISGLIGPDGAPGGRADAPYRGQRERLRLRHGAPGRPVCGEA